jgi:hypothetical protein
MGKSPALKGATMQEFLNTQQQLHVQFINQEQRKQLTKSTIQMQNNQNPQIIKKP